MTASDRATTWRKTRPAREGGSAADVVRRGAAQQEAWAKTNARQRDIIDRLVEENAQLRARLISAGVEDPTGRTS